VEQAPGERVLRPVTFVLLKVIDAVIGLRVDADAELAGLDLSEHAETGYIL
jgi:Amt family ammonium transporter